VKIDVKEGEKSYQRVMEVEIPWEEVADDYEETVEEFCEDFEMPGFRKGKVPREVIKRKYGEQLEYQFASDSIDDYYRNALDQIDEDPVNRATIESLEFSEGQPFRFTARFEVEPEASIFNYKQGFTIEHTTHEATPADVDDALDDLRERHADVEEVEEGAGEGHLLLVDMQQVEPDGTPVIGQKVEDRYIKAGEGVFGGENLERLKGATKGETRRVSFQPEDSDETEYYDVSVKKVEEQTLPELNDDFAKELDVDAETYDELRDELQSRIQSHLDEDDQSNLQRQIAQKFVANSEVEVPESMIDNYLDMLIEDVKRQRSQGGQEPEIDEKAFKENYRSDAIFNLKWQLIRKQIIEEEELEITDEEMEEKIEDIVEQYPEEKRDAVRNLYNNPQYQDRIREDILADKAMEHVKSFADIKETRKTTAEVRQEHEARQAAESAIEEVK